ncbi:hypothetical protein CSQ88_06645 [Iodobacter sp. BJB302]|nr:hypothetical protein CSQ88_06645 [Iodobacter sp. BJB302]
MPCQWFFRFFDKKVQIAGFSMSLFCNNLFLKHKLYGLHVRAKCGWHEKTCKTVFYFQLLFLF